MSNHNKGKHKHKHPDLSHSQTHLHTHIVNLSSKHLSTPQLNLLTKGLGFVPNPKLPPDLKQGLTKLTREYRLRFYFQNRDNADNPVPNLPPFKKTSTWAPPKADQITESYLVALPHKLDALQPAPWKQNTNRLEWQALRTLSRDTDLVINKADKGSCIVVQDRMEYVAQGEKHLSNTTIYEQLSEDPTIQLSLAINHFVANIHRKGHISDDMKAFLTLPKDVRTQKCYFLTKLHKTPRDVRPIISGCEGPTEKVSALLDYFLQPLVLRTKSHINDSKSLVAKLEQVVLPNTILLSTIDVKSLYLHIPQDEGIMNIQNILSNVEGEDHEPPFPAPTMAEMLSIVLKHNVFEFNSTMYRQVSGTAMGTRMAPSFANLFMATLEEQFIEGEPIKPLLWLRYIDDILCIWPDSQETLTAFLNRLNCYHSTLRFTWEVSTKEVSFLDLEIYKGSRFEQSGILDLRPHYKSSNSFQYLHRSSAHPPSTHRGVVKGELIRLLRASSSEVTYTINKEKIILHFKDRGYSEALLNKVSAQVKFSDRHKHLEEKTTNMRPPPLLITRYHPSINRGDLHSALSPPPSLARPIVCYTRNKSVASHLVRARLPRTKTPAPSQTAVKLTHRPTMKTISAPCGKTLCGCCRVMSRKERVYGKDGKSYSTATNTTCDTESVIYLLECSSCPQGRYVGQTKRSIKNRMAGHRAANQHKNLPLYNHYRKRDHSFADARVTILEKTTPSNLLDCELSWMHRLGTILPYGLNSMYS